MNQQKQLPKFLYKYFSKAKYAECIFRHNELYFRNPDTFNDPFDCKPRLTLNRDWDEEECIKFYICIEKEALHRGLRDLTDKQKQSCEKRAKEQYNRNKNQVTIELNEIIEKGLKTINEFRVLCLSENYNNMLMWSHYAEGHRGFVLKFDTKALSKKFEPHRIEKVIYLPRRSYPSVKDYYQNNGTHMFLIVKSGQWKYEDEWRILMRRGDEDKPEEERKPYQLEKGSITRIILGYNMTPQDKKKISQWRLRYQSEIELYEAIKGKSSYNINIRNFLNN